jgi:hypothetical protein
MVIVIYLIKKLLINITITISVIVIIIYVIAVIIIVIIADYLTNIVISLPIDIILQIFIYFI